MWRIVSFIFVVVVFAVWLYFQNISLNMMDWSRTTTQTFIELSTDFGANRGIAERNAEPKPATLQERLQFKADNISGESAFDPDRFVRNRIIRTEHLMGIEDVLEDGEAAPTEAYEMLYMQARAASMMRRDCADLLVRLATECIVAKVSVNKKRKFGYRIKGDLRYEPAYDIGPKAEKSAEIVKGSAKLTLAELGQDSPEARQAYLDQAMAICDDLRNAFGNCFISHVNFSLRTADNKRVGEDFHLFANAGFSVHGVWSVVNEATLKSKISDLVGTDAKAN